MEASDTLKVITERYKIDPTLEGKIDLPVSRWHDFGHLLKALGYKKGVEVGVYKGVFIQTMASRATETEIIGVDAWTTYEGYKDYPPGDLETVGYPQAIARAAKHPNVKLIKGWSKDIAPTFEDGSVDFVYIDANHTYPCVKEDIGLWAPKVKVGGLVCGHDYFETKNVRKLVELDFGVIKAVNEWVESQGIKHLFTTSLDPFPSWFFIQGDTK